MPNLGGKYFEKIVSELAEEKKREKIVIDSNFKNVLKNQILEKADLKITNTSPLDWGKTWSGLKYFVAGGISLAVLTVAAFNFNNLKLLVPSSQYIPKQNTAVKNSNTATEKQPVSSSENVVNNSSVTDKPMQKPELITFSGASVMPPDEIIHPQKITGTQSLETPTFSSIEVPPSQTNTVKVPGVSITIPKTEVITPTVTGGNNSLSIPPVVQQPLVFGDMNMVPIDSQSSSQLPGQNSTAITPAIVENTGNVDTANSVNNTTSNQAVTNLSGNTSTSVSGSDGTVTTVPLAQQISPTNNIEPASSYTIQNNGNVTSFAAPAVQLSNSSLEYVNPVQEFSVAPTNIVSRQIQMTSVLDGSTLSPDLKNITVVNANLDNNLVQSLIESGFADKLSQLNQNDLFEVDQLESGKIKIRFTEDGVVTKVVIFAQDLNTGSYNVVTSIE